MNTTVNATATPFLDCVEKYRPQIAIEWRFRGTINSVFKPIFPTINQYEIGEILTSDGEVIRHCRATIPPDWDSVTNFIKYCITLVANFKRSQDDVRKLKVVLCASIINDSMSDESVESVATRLHQSCSESGLFDQYDEIIISDVCDSKHRLFRYAFDSQSDENVATTPKLLNCNIL
jgi:hypothetical protein